MKCKSTSPLLSTHRDFNKKDRNGMTALTSLTNDLN